MKIMLIAIMLTMKATMMTINKIDAQLFDN